MIKRSGLIAFGFIEGTPYGEVTDTREYMEGLADKGSLPKDKVIKHLNELSYDIATYGFNKDFYTGKDIPVAIYHDGNFIFPYETVIDYKIGRIGLPPEYEEYLNKII